MARGKTRDPRAAAKKSVEEAIEAVTHVAEAGGLTPGKALNFRKFVQESGNALHSVAARLDPIRRPTLMFDPSAPAASSHIVALALLGQHPEPLGRLTRFYGSGVYAIYYKGQFSPYSRISDSDTPIYVGKARPKSSDAATAVQQGTSLHTRLAEHAQSIDEVGNLDVEDFQCRFLVVRSGVEDAAESYLINLFKPVWNKEVRLAFGIGKHGDDAGTRGNRRSPWDTLHPGREWAKGTREDQKSKDEILAALRDHFEAVPPKRTWEEILTGIVNDVRQFTQTAMHGTEPVLGMPTVLEELVALEEERE
jgi:hypothetical protein